MRHLLLLLALAGCAANGVSPDERERAALAEDLAGRAAGAPENCVSALPAQNLTVVDSRTLVLRSGSTLWVNRLEAECPGLRPLDILIVEMRGSQYCRGDHVRPLPRGSTIPGPICPLGSFTPYRRAS